MKPQGPEFLNFAHTTIVQTLPQGSFLAPPRDVLDLADSVKNCLSEISEIWFEALPIRPRLRVFK